MKLTMTLLAVSVATVLPRIGATQALAANITDVRETMPGPVTPLVGSILPANAGVGLAPIRIFKIEPGISGSLRPDQPLLERVGPVVPLIQTDKMTLFHASGEGSGDVIAVPSDINPGDRAAFLPGAHGKSASLFTVTSEMLPHFLAASKGADPEAAGRAASAFFELASRQARGETAAFSDGYAPKEEIERLIVSQGWKLKHFSLSSAGPVGDPPHYELTARVDVRLEDRSLPYPVVFRKQDMLNALGGAPESQRFLGRLFAMNQVRFVPQSWRSRSSRALSALEDPRSSDLDWARLAAFAAYEIIDVPQVTRPYEESLVNDILRQLEKRSSEIPESGRLISAVRSVMETGFAAISDRKTLVPIQHTLGFAIDGLANTAASPDELTQRLKDLKNRIDAAALERRGRESAQENNPSYWDFEKDLRMQEISEVRMPAAPAVASEMDGNAVAPSQAVSLQPAEHFPTRPHSLRVEGAPLMIPDTSITPELTHLFGYMRRDQSTLTAEEFRLHARMIPQYPKGMKPREFQQLLDRFKEGKALDREAKMIQAVLSELAPGDFILPSTNVQLRDERVAWVSLYVQRDVRNGSNVLNGLAFLDTETGAAYIIEPMRNSTARHSRQ